MDQNQPYYSKIPAIIKTIVLFFSLSILTACSFSLAEDITPPPGAEVPFEKPTQPSLSGPLYPMVPPDPSAGSVTYAEKCAPCHGVTGLGDGSMAGQLPVPAPALGTEAVARQASPAVWYVIVTQGNLERRMPPFSSLTDRQRWDVVAYLYSLSNPPERILQGKELYTENCASCHGMDGNGKGPEATKLSVPPTNFTDQELMADLSSELLFQAISEGIPPDMPAFGEQFPTEELWALSTYLRSFTFSPQITVSDLPETPTPAVTQTSETVQVSPTVENVAGLGVVGGQVIGTSAGDLAADLSVTLRGFDQMQQTFTANTPIEADGSFIFENVPMPEGRAFLASMEYDGVAYSSDIAVVDSETTNIELSIPYYGTTSDITQLSVDRLHLLIEYLEPDTLRVVEMYIISNSGDRTVVATEEDQPVLSYSLPDGATNIQFQDGTVGERFVLQAGGFGDYAVIRPGTGQHQVIYSFDLPYKKKLNFNHPLDLPVDAVIILLPEDGIRITGEQLNDMGTRDVQGGAYRMYSKELIEAGSNLEIEISGRPKTSGAGLVLGSSRNLVIGVSAFGIALILAGGWLYMRTRNGRTEQDMLDSDEETLADLDGEDVDTLLDAILALDDQYKAGELPKDAYLKRRIELKTKIKEILQEEE